jgi:hypothetical protein
MAKESLEASLGDWPTLVGDATLCIQGEAAPPLPPPGTWIRRSILRTFFEQLDSAVRERVADWTYNVGVADPSAASAKLLRSGSALIDDAPELSEFTGTLPDDTNNGNTNFSSSSTRTMENDCETPVPVTTIVPSASTAFPLTHTSSSPSAIDSDTGA